MKNSIFILGLVLLTTGITFSQQATGKGVLDRLYFKAGAEFYSLKRDNFRYSGDVNNICLIGSIIYDYNDRVQTEFVYKYGFERDYGINEIRYIKEGELISQGEYEYLSDYNIDLKMNWFLSSDKTMNPIYLTGILEFDVQNRNNSYYNDRRDTSEYNTNYSLWKTSSYNRVLVGPGLGVGFFLAFGRIDFQAEVNSVFRIAPFVDKGYRELLLNVTSGLVYKF